MVGQAEADRTKGNKQLSADPVRYVSRVREFPCRMFLGLCVSPVLANFWLCSGETTSFDCKNTNQIVEQMLTKHCITVRFMSRTLGLQLFTNTSRNLKGKMQQEYTKMG